VENWRRVWRDGFAPCLSDAGLRALLAGLESDDPRLVQGATTMPPPMWAGKDWPVESACATGYCGWRGDGLETVAEVEEFFARLCFNVDQRLGEPAGCRHWLNWWDESPRDHVFREMLSEVRIALAGREC
jgi:hypothetical protein